MRKQTVGAGKGGRGEGSPRPRQLRQGADGAPLALCRAGWEARKFPGWEVGGWVVLGAKGKGEQKMLGGLGGVARPVGGTRPLSRSPSPHPQHHATAPAQQERRQLVIAAHKALAVHQAESCRPSMGSLLKCPQRARAGPGPLLRAGARDPVKGAVAAVSQGAHEPKLQSGARSGTRPRAVWCGTWASLLGQTATPVEWDEGAVTPPFAQDEENRPTGIAQARVSVRGQAVRPSLRCEGWGCQGDTPGTSRSRE